MATFLLKDNYINSRLNELTNDYEKKYKFVEIKFLLEEKDFKHLVINKKFKEKDQLITILNYLKNEIGFFNNLRVFYYSKDKEAKTEINFQMDLTIIEFLKEYEIPQEFKNQYVLKYDYSPGKYDPLYLC